jgi:cardiolipin synthase
LRDLPNLLSVVRMACAIPIAWLLLHEYFDAALLTFTAAGLSDGLDGYLAKRFGWRSRLGSILDPLADKALLVTVYLVLGAMDLLPLWLVAVVIARDVVVVSGALGIHMLVGRYEMAPSLASKLNTALQLILVVAVISAKSFATLPEWLIDGLTYGVLAATVWSGVDYVWNWGVQAMRVRSVPTSRK